MRTDGDMGLELTCTTIVGRDEGTDGVECSKQVPCRVEGTHVLVDRAKSPRKGMGTHLFATTGIAGRPGPPKKAKTYFAPVYKYI